MAQCLAPTYCRCVDPEIPLDWLPFCCFFALPGRSRLAAKPEIRYSENSWNSFLEIQYGTSM